MSDPQPAPLLWERRPDFAKWLLSMGLALGLGILVGRTIEPETNHFYRIVDPPVTPATSAPATPADVTP